MKFLTFIILTLMAFGGMGICQSEAQRVITFGPGETRIDGSIPCSVIGKYEVQFTAFKGKIILNEKLRRIQSVYLEIEAGSLKSNVASYDKIARSRRLLYTRRYPKIIFKSDQIIQDESGYIVKGVLEMHGVKRRMVFPFQVTIMVDEDTHRKLLDIKGRWNINRKDFNIVWSRYLDHGGVLVGDILTVSWGISEYIK